MTDEALIFELNQLDKDHLISLFIRLKNINNKLLTRVNLLENQLNELTSFDDLINSII